MKKQIPKFQSEQEEQEFWASHDSTEFLDWSKAAPAVFPDLQPTTKTISIRLTESMIATIKTLAHKRDVPYQSLIKAFLQDRIDAELRH